ncbi:MULTISPECIES: putative nucleotide-diphospho-sugar transferase [unclassified Mesorhizobium]|uniref:putative nucleotide-diphospho-sugar transferase n=1 Tax=unclassified Mesorhizobium TaxID=325217 RepID=UPI001AEE6605|nr:MULTISPECIES: putative nucleotide-diphospho-sugar transferase [unclassified Mesorhizobium]MBZ9981359.1 nucleotide-diphospho-sugar transferase [Mesorhizobium sp. BR-1-1-8]
MLTHVLDLFRATKHRHREMLAPFPINPQPSGNPDKAGEIVAFFTINSFYETEAARMTASAWRLGLSVQARPFADAGSWVRNASLKPTFLVNMRRRLQGPLLYVDVDTVFHHDPWPELAGFDCDIAVYRESGRLMAGTILINDTPAAREILALWKKRSDENPEVWDQVVLQEILDEDQASASPRYREGQLPAPFCWVFDRLENGKPDKVYIEQLQASREIYERHARGKARRGLNRRQDRVRTIERILDEHRERLRR